MFYQLLIVANILIKSFIINNENNINYYNEKIHPEQILIVAYHKALEDFTFRANRYYFILDKLTIYKNTITTFRSNNRMQTITIKAVYEPKHEEIRLTACNIACFASDTEFDLNVLIKIYKGLLFLITREKEKAEASQNGLLLIGEGHH
uniref:Uncharacterized protein n=1 Tax=Meloidogyne enterolobii TaxID=390850 RepID=A0A6V7X6M6_MELEN|nr:unnamed protein product [Meloidogyne enterolobii]